MHCPFCQNPQVELIDIEITTFTHLDFSDFGDRAQIIRCPNCQSLTNVQALNKINQIESLYKQPRYVRSKQTAQTFIVPEEPKPVTRSFLQARILHPYLKKNAQPYVLDIGCFDGQLLLELSRHFPQGQFRGFDINEKLQDIFPSESNFHLWISDPLQIEGQFDLICMSHSILYIVDLSALFRLILELLKPNGLLFVQAPSMILNPYQLLLSDQYHYFSPTSLKNVLQYSGYESDFIDYEWFPRDLLVFAKPNPMVREQAFREDVSVYQSIQVLHENRDKLNNLSKNYDLAVLGTTVTATFVDSILAQKNKFFVDENMDSTHGTFRGKSVIHPNSMDKSVHLVLPYGRSNIGIKKMFMMQYELEKFILI